MCRLFHAGALACLLLVGCGKPAGKPAQSKADFPGRSLVMAGKYEEAIPVLETDLKQDPRGPHASRAGLFIGKAHLALGQLDEAAATFEETARKHPNTLEAHKCRYKLALVAMLKDDREDARRRFTELAENPDGPLAAESQALADFLSESNRP